MKIEIRDDHVAIAPEERSTMEKRIQVGLTPFVADIHVATARLRETRGPLGAVEIACQLMIVTTSGVTVLIDERATSTKAAMDVALERARVNLASGLAKKNKARAKA